MVMPREIVKKTTSLKKTDTPPEKKRPSKNKPAPTGNEAAFRDRNAGRAANKAKSTEVPPAPKKGGKPKSLPGDRKLRSGKVDSEKALKQAGWSDKDAAKELEIEEAAEADAEAEAAEDAQSLEPKVAKKSLQEYLAERNSQGAGLVTAKATRKVEAIEGEKIEKVKEEFVAPSVEKKQKQKARKEKQFLDFSPVFADEARESPRGGKGGRGGRGGKAGAKGGRGGKKPVARGAPLDEKNFPSLA